MAADAKIDEFIPTRPPFHIRRSHALLSVLKARGNLLSTLREKDYHKELFRIRIFKRDYIICNASEHVRYAFLKQHENFDKKSPHMRHALEPLLGDGLFVSDGDLWRERRDACAPALRSELLHMFVPKMVDTSQERIEKWKAHPKDEPIEMLAEMGKLTARIIGRTVFGDDVPEDEAAQVIKGFAKYQEKCEVLRMSDMTGINALKILRNPIKEWFAERYAKRVHEVIDRIIERHKENPNADPKTLLSLFLNPEEAGTKCPHAGLKGDALRNEAIVMFMAGHETTANTMAWAWYLLDSAPQKFKKLKQELKRVLNGRLPTFEDVPALKYTRAVIEETLRLYPPVPVLTRQAREHDQIGHLEVKPGDVVVVCAWLLHRHRAYWKKPDHFVPERFMPDKPKPDKFIYVPFSVGPRVCLGLRFGLTEAILCLATLAQEFTPSVVPGHNVEINCRLTLRPKGGLPMFLNPVN